MNFFEVWIQIFKTIGYLYQHQLIDAKQGDLARDFVEKFCSLQPVYQEALYPELHAKTEELTDKKDPQLIITFIKGFLGNFADIRRTYAIVDGFMNVLESGNCKTKVITALQASTATATTAFTLINKLKNPLQVHELLLLAVDYLTSHLNYGVFTGVTGANLDVVVKLDLGI